MEIPISKGKVALIDKEDFELVSKHNWYFTGKYARCGHKPNHLMHRLIMGIPTNGMTIDHINRNGLDNRRNNLRIVTVSQNNINRGISRRNTSGYTGVHWHSRRKKWIAVLQIDKKKIALGIFDTKEEAIKCRKEGEKKHYKEFAIINI